MSSDLTTKDMPTDRRGDVPSDVPIDVPDDGPGDGPGDFRPTLRQALQLAAADLARHEPPPFERIWPAAALPAPSQRLRRPTWGWAGVGSMLVAATALCSLVLVLQPWAPAPKPDAPQVVLRDGWELLAGGFMPVAGAERWVEPGRDVARGWVVRAELPAERLAGLGLPFDPGQAAERVPAELLLRANGELLAVRVLP